MLFSLQIHSGRHAIPDPLKACRVTYLLRFGQLYIAQKTFSKKLVERKELIQSCFSVFRVHSQFAILKLYIWSICGCIPTLNCPFFRTQIELLFLFEPIKLFKTLCATSDRILLYFTHQFKYLDCRIPRTTKVLLVSLKLLKDSTSQQKFTTLKPDTQAQPVSQLAEIKTCFAVIYYPRRIQFWESFWRDGQG